MEKLKNKEFKDMLIGFGVILLYFIMSSIPQDIIRIFGINYNNLNTISRAIYLITYEVILTLTIIYIYRKDFIPNLKIFIKDIKKYLSKYIKYWFILLGLMVLSNIIVTMFTTTEISNNQAGIVEILKHLPIYTFIVTVLIAPFLEELVFRLSFRKIFAHSNILFIFFSGLLFGSMHVLGTCENLIDLLFIIPYSIPGFIFAYTLKESDNICVPISLHLIHNGVMMLLQLLLMILI